MAEERTIVSFDYAIKYLLRDKADFVILSGFLSELLKRRVEVTAILESESNKADEAGKINRVDLKARIDDSELAVFEIQFHEKVDFFSRVLYGVAKAIVEQVPVGATVYDVKKVYSINIAYYNLGANREYLFNAKLGGFRGVNFTDETIPFAQAASKPSPKADIHPEYYLILPNMFDEQLRSGFDQWIYVLKNSAVRSDFTAEGIKEAAVKLDMLNMQPAERKAYEKYLENKSSLDCAIYTAEEKGKAKGKAESATQIAKALKDSGVDVNIIAKSTGLSADEIIAM